MQEQINGRELVARYWQEQMQKHPRVFAILNILKGCIEFFGAGHVVPWLLYKTLIFSSRVADGVLIAAALWITALNVAPAFMTSLVGGADSASSLSSMALLAFSLLPELITVAALVITIKHWLAFFKRRERTNVAWIWGTLYAIPTGTFLGMTVYTIISFVSKDGGLAQITGLALVVRCLAAWGYSFVEILYFELGRQAVIEADERAKLRQENADLRNSATEQMRKFAADMSAKDAELSALRQRIETAEKELAARNSAPVPAELPQSAEKIPARESAPVPRKKPGEKEARNTTNVLEIGAKRAAIEKRNAQILELKQANAALSNREIAAHVGCDEKTVRLFLRKKDAELPQDSGEYSAVNE